MRQNAWKNNLIAAMVLPPVIGLILYIVEVFKRKEQKSLYILAMISVVICMYCYPTYDTFGRFADTGRNISFSEILDGDPVTNIITFFNPYIDAFYLLYFVWLFALLFFIWACTAPYKKDNKLQDLVIFICVFGITLPDLYDLTYSTLATTFCLYTFQKYNSKYLMYIPLCFVVFCFHFGTFMVLPGAIALNFLLKHDRKLFAIIFIVAYFFFIKMVIGGGMMNLVFYLNDNIFANTQASFDNYTSEGQFGLAGFDIGLKGLLWHILLYSIYMGIIVFSLINYKKMKDYFCVSFLVIGGTVLLNVYEFYVLAERVNIMMHYSSLVVVVYLLKNGCLNNFWQTTVASITVMLFCLGFFIFGQNRSKFFVNVRDSYSISYRTLYLPSSLLYLDLHDLGFSDDYINKNGTTRVRSR